jgi:hypothetical protein
MTRWKAFLIHLGLSAVLYVVLLYLIVFLWYPQPYFASDGGWQAVRLITGVDLVLGPLLTLIVFKSGKPGLRRDLSLIGILQVVALVWGTWMVYEQRIAMVTYADGTFYTLNNEQVHDAGGQAPAVAAQSSSTPPYAFVRLPADARERQELRLKTLFSAKLLHQLGERYEPLGNSNLPEVLAHAVEIEKYPAVSEQNRENLDRFLVRHGGAPQDYAFLPLRCRYQEMLLAVRRADGRIIDSLDIDPSKSAASSPPANDKRAVK